MGREYDMNVLSGLYSFDQLAIKLVSYKCLLMAWQPQRQYQSIMFCTYLCCIPKALFPTCVDQPTI